MHLLFEEPYAAGLGPFMLQLHASTAIVQVEELGAETVLRTPGHEITLRRPVVPTDGLPAGMSVSAAAAWAFYIRKHSADEERLLVSLRLMSPTPALEIGPHTGQWLTAIELASSTRQVHLGTQDEDWYAWRAAADPWVPPRLAAELGSYGLMITAIGADGLQTQVPRLREQEQFYFHYILAESPRRKSVEFPDEWDTSTWFCVEQTREKLEKAWQQSSKKSAVTSLHSRTPSRNPAFGPLPMISTQNPAALPEPAALQRVCRSMAVLDAINCPEWEYRYHSYDPAWGEDEAVFQLNTGEGDEMLILFRPEGCCINGYVHEYAQPDKARVTQGLPAAFEEFMFGEPVSSIGTTFCLWYTPAQGWQTGELDQAADDGSEEMLYLLDGRPEAYAEWANEYFVEDTGRPLLEVADVASIYQGQPLTREVAQRLNPELEQEDLESLVAELQEIGYPYEFSR